MLRFALCTMHCVVWKITVVCAVCIICCLLIHYHVVTVSVATDGALLCHLMHFVQLSCMMQYHVFECSTRSDVLQSTGVQWSTESDALLSYMYQVPWYSKYNALQRWFSINMAWSTRPLLNRDNALRIWCSTIPMLFEYVPLWVW